MAVEVKRCVGVQTLPAPEGACELIRKRRGQVWVRRA